jgi:hypothetical protein
MLKVVKMPMKKNYYYLFTLNDMDPGPSELIEFNSLYPDENSIYRDVISYLDQQSFDISNSVVARLVEYAGNQVRNGYLKPR